MKTISGSLGPNANIFLHNYMHPAYTIKPYMTTRASLWHAIQSSNQSPLDKSPLMGIFLRKIIWDLNRFGLVGQFEVCQFHNITFLNLQICPNVRMLCIRKYNTLGCWIAGTTVSSTKHLMFQVLFFLIISCKIVFKNYFNIFL